MTRSVILVVTTVLVIAGAAVWIHGQPKSDKLTPQDLREIEQLVQGTREVSTSGQKTPRGCSPPTASSSTWGAP